MSKLRTKIKIFILRQFEWWALPPKFRQTFRKLQKQGYIVSWSRKCPEDITGNRWQQDWAPYQIHIGHNTKKDLYANFKHR